MSVRRSLALVSPLVACLAALVAGIGTAAAAAPGEVTSFAVPGCLSGGEDFAAAAGKGVLLRTCAKSGQSFSDTLAHLLPSGKIVSQRVPRSEPGPILAGPAGEIWSVAESEQSPAAEGAALSIDRIARDGGVTTFPLGTAEGPYTAIKVRGLVADEAGAVWLALGDLSPDYYLQPADSAGGELVHIAADGTVSRFRVPDEVEPGSLVRGPDGNLWFTGVSGRSSGERTFNPGTGYIGKIAPAGEFTLYPTPNPGSGPGGIAVGPDGRLWFNEGATGVNEIGTIGTDGTFGPSLEPHSGLVGDQLTFGTEGNAWLPIIEAGLLRITPAGQETVYPQVHGYIVNGHEGDIWSLEYTRVRRVVPGAPGIELTDLAIDRPSRRVSFDLACGGSTSACKGTVDLELRNRGESPREPATEKSRFRFLEKSYRLAPESQRTLTLPIPAKTFAMGKRDLSPRARNRSVLRIVARATVEGGPTLRRKLWLTPGAQAGSAARATK